MKDHELRMEDFIGIIPSPPWLTCIILELTMLITIGSLVGHWRYGVVMQSKHDRR